MSTVMNVVTDVVLTAQCGVAWNRLHAGGSIGRTWSRFFASMAGAGAAGAVRHAIHDETALRVAALLGMNATLAAAVIAAQRATLEWRPPREHASLTRAFDVLLGSFAASALWRLDFTPAFAYATLAFAWILVAATAATRKERPGAREIATGLLLACVAALVYAARVTPAEWFDHVDLAHSILIGSLGLLYRGAIRAAEASPRFVQEHASSEVVLNTEGGRVS